MKTRILASVFGLAVALALGGCVIPEAPSGTPVRAVPMKTAFDPASLDPYKRTGHAEIAGQAFLTTRGGDVKVGAGREVVLFPATPFFREVATHMEHGYRPLAYQTVRSQFHAAAHKTIADAQGNFEFRSLPAGDYMLEVEIRWEIPGYGGGSVITGGMVRKFVTIADGEELRVMLTK